MHPLAELWLRPPHISAGDSGGRRSPAALLQGAMEQRELLRGQHLGEKHLLPDNSANPIWNWQERINVKPSNVISGVRLPEGQTDKHAALHGGADAPLWSRERVFWCIPQLARSICNSVSLIFCHHLCSGTSRKSQSHSSLQFPLCAGNDTFLHPHAVARFAADRGNVPWQIPQN